MLEKLRKTITAVLSNIQISKEETVSNSQIDENKDVINNGKI